MNGDKVFLERTLDRALHIYTTGLREWGKDGSGYNRYEATPYGALEQFFSNYKLTEEDQFVDVGCGRGRVAFYVHDKFQIPVKGIEANDRTFDEALKNLETYLKRKHHIANPIHFDYGLAEQFPLDKKDNRFYFFNPFSAKIFKRVIMNIRKSIMEHPREVEIILYYPLESYQDILQTAGFFIVNQMKVRNDHGKYGKFIVYRFMDPQ